MSKHSKHTWTMTRMGWYLMLVVIVALPVVSGVFAYQQAAAEEPTATPSTTVPPTTTAPPTSTPVNPVRALPDTVFPGQTFDVTVTFNSPADGFNTIGLTDFAPENWNVAVDADWCTPAAQAVTATGNRAEIAWWQQGGFSSGTAFTAVYYHVTVPDDTSPGAYTFPGGTLEYRINGSNPATVVNITGDSQVSVSYSSPYPDLIIFEKHEEWVPGEEGSQYTVHYTVANIGGVPVPAGHDVQLVVDSAIIEQMTIDTVLAPGATVSGSFNTVINMTGESDTITICADVNNEVSDELDETNNCLTNTWWQPPDWTPFIADQTGDTYNAASPDIIGGDYQLTASHVALRFRSAEPLNAGNFGSETFLDVDQNPKTGYVSTWEQTPTNDIGADYMVTAFSLAPPLPLSASRGVGGSPDSTPSGSLFRWGNGNNGYSPSSPASVERQLMGQSQPSVGLETEFQPVIGYLYRSAGNGGFEPIGRVDVILEGNSYWYVIPLAMLGDDGNMDVVEIIGNMIVPTDYAPNSGHGTVGNYTLTLSIDPEESGTVNLDPAQPEGGYVGGTIVTLTPNPATGYVFDHWSGDNILTINSTLGEIMANPQGEAILRECLGDAIVDNPQLEMAYFLDLPTIAPMSGGAITAEMVACVETHLEELAAGVILTVRMNANKNITAHFAQPSGVTVTVNAPARVPTNYDFTVSIDISEVTDLNSVQYDIGFDTSVLRLDSIDAGQIAATSIPAVRNEISEGHYRVVQSLGLSSVSGSGSLAVLHFHSVGAMGTSSAIDISNGLLSGMNGAIPATWVDDAVQVSVIPGDANGDGAVNVLDMTKVAREILQLDQLTSGADANLDGQVNVLDMTKIARIILLLDPS